MHNVWTIAKREYNLYFSSPVAYVVAFIIFLILGVFFYYTLLIANSAAAMQQSYVPSIDVILWWMGLLLAFLTPALTTRLLAEERRLGTIELLMTAPVKDWELVVGKWLGAFLLLLTLIALDTDLPSHSGPAGFTGHRSGSIDHRLSGADSDRRDAGGHWCFHLLLVQQSNCCLSSPPLG